MTHGNTEDVRIAPLIDRRSYVRKHVTIVVGPRELPTPVKERSTTR